MGAHRRLIFAASATGVAVAVAVASFAFAAAHHPTHQQVRADKPQTGATTPSVGGDASPTTTATVPAPPTSAVRRSVTTTTAKPSTAPQTSSDAAKFAAMFGPLPPGATIFPYVARQSSWTGASNGVNGHFTIDPPNPRSSSSVTFTIDITTADHRCCAVYVLFGDQSSKNVNDLGTASYSCPPGPKPTNGIVHASVQHAYNKPGHMLLGIGAQDAGCPGDKYNSGYYYFQIDIAPGGPPTSQGPSVPTVQLDQYGTTNDSHNLHVFAQAQDDDGWVSKFVLDWGDGSPKVTLPGDGMGCRPTTSGWPAPSRAVTNPPPGHLYTNVGTYTESVTAISTGCDGSHPQQAVATFHWTVR